MLDESMKDKTNITFNDHDRNTQISNGSFEAAPSFQIPDTAQLPLAGSHSSLSRPLTPSLRKTRSDAGGVCLPFSGAKALRENTSATAGLLDTGYSCRVGFVMNPRRLRDGSTFKS